MIDFIKNQFTLLNFKKYQIVSNCRTLSSQKFSILFKHFFQFLVLLLNFIFIIRNSFFFKIFKFTLCVQSFEANLQSLIDIRSQSTSAIIKSSINFMSLQWICWIIFFKTFNHRSNKSEIG